MYKKNSFEFYIRKSNNLNVAPFPREIIVQKLKLHKISLCWKNFRNEITFYFRFPFYFFSNASASWPMKAWLELRKGNKESFEEKEKRKTEEKEEMEKERISGFMGSRKRAWIPRDYRLPSPVGQVDTPGTPHPPPSKVCPLPPRLLVTSFYQHSSSKQSTQAQCIFSYQMCHFFFFFFISLLHKSITSPFFPLKLIENFFNRSSTS